MCVIFLARLEDDVASGDEEELLVFPPAVMKKPSVLSAQGIEWEQMGRPSVVREALR